MKNGRSLLGAARAWRKKVFIIVTEGESDLPIVIDFLLL